MGSNDTTASGPPPRDNLPFHIGSVVGRYRLVEYIASGGMGAVYEARPHAHERLDRARFALKLLNAGLDTTEADVLQRLDHPNIVRIHDAGSIVDNAGHTRHYVVMQLLQNACPLTEHADRHALSLADRVRLITDACHAIEYASPVAHHLDLKPSNILVDKFGQVYVCDFGGASRRAEAEPVASTLTPEYCAPEQLSRTKANLDERADQYGLAATLYELISGDPPHQIRRGEHAEDIAAAKCEPLPSISTLRPEADHRLHAILRRALEPDPDKRYESVRDFRQELESWLARHESPFGRASLLLRTKPRMRFIAVWLLAACLGTWLGGFVLAPHAAKKIAWESRMTPPPSNQTTDTESLRHVTLVALPTGDEIAAIAQELDIEGVDPAVPATWRRVYARICDALAGRCRAIVFDLDFPTDHDADEAFAGAIRAAMAGGTPVVVGSKRRDTDAEGRPALSATLWESGVHWGYYTLAVHLETPRVPLLTDDGDRTYPSLALTAVAAAFQPEGYAHFEFTTDRQIAMRFWSAPTTARPGARRTLAEHGIIMPTTTQPYTDLSFDAFARGFRKTDLVAWLQQPVHPEPVRRASTVPLSDVLTGDVTSLKLHDKIVLVFDGARERPVPTATGMTQPAYFHAAAIDMLVEGRTLRLWTFRDHLPSIVLSAAIGSALGIASVFVSVTLPHRCRLGSASSRTVAALALMCLLSGIITVMHSAGVALAASGGRLASPIPSALTLVLSSMLAIVLTALVPKSDTQRTPQEQP